LRLSKSQRQKPTPQTSRPLFLRIRTFGPSAAARPMARSPGLQLAVPDGVAPSSSPRLRSIAHRDLRPAVPSRPIGDRTCAVARPRADENCAVESLSFNDSFHLERTPVKRIRKAYVNLSSSISCNGARMFCSMYPCGETPLDKESIHFPRGFPCQWREMGSRDERVGDRTD
jgi:hypothetical protein